jgi:predicted amidophosphoribosyltransferase
MNTCVCCGAEIPEGRQVCWNCENATDEPDLILKDGTKLYLKNPKIPGGDFPDFDLYRIVGKRG